ncbi:MAG TPA: biotin--[acetyl-CoA-carboxylase] ligase [Blastocatellia bacterium]|nr:biotin--[acetyl-CoA-carboxylase] ligase [Blastocatellia bacterium]
MITHRPPFIVHHFATLGSTNDFLKAMTAEPEFTCVVADEQTAGRGRRDRQWHSSPGDGLYLSILLLPQSSTRISLLSLMSSVAVAETLLERGVTGVDIKWPNDVLVNGRKLCGILVESIGSGTYAPRIIVGIGVNLNHQSFPDELGLLATSLKIETEQTTDVEEFRDQLLKKIYDWYVRWQRGEGGLILDRWQELSSYALGLQITVTLDDEQLSGETAGLTEDGALILRLKTGTLRRIFSGDVTRLRKNADDQIKQ